MQTYKSTSANETITIATELGKKLRGGEIIAYKGDLGAGKTTFTRGLAIGMGLDDDVSSPTFSIVNEYHKNGCLSLYHFDMYRILDSFALESTGFFDYISDTSVIAIEWSENIESVLEEFNIITISLEGIGDERIITIAGDEYFC